MKLLTKPLKILLILVALLLIIIFLSKQNVDINIERTDSGSTNSIDTVNVP